MADTIGLGTILYVNDGGAGAFAEILYVVALTHPAPEIEFSNSDYLNMGSRVHIKKPVMCAPGNWQFTVKYDMTERARMETLRALTLNGTCPIFKITLTDTKFHTQSAWVKKVGNITQIDNFNQYTVELEGNSEVTVT